MDTRVFHWGNLQRTKTPKSISSSSRKWDDLGNFSKSSSNPIRVKPQFTVKFYQQKSEQGFQTLVTKFPDMPRNHPDCPKNSLPEFMTG